MGLKGVRPLEASVRLCTVVIVAVYCGNLTATLAVPKLKWPFTDLQGLASSEDYMVLIEQNTIREDLLSVSICTYQNLKSSLGVFCIILFISAI